MMCYLEERTLHMSGPSRDVVAARRTIETVLSRLATTASAVAVGLGEWPAGAHCPRTLDITATGGARPTATGANPPGTEEALSPQSPTAASCSTSCDVPLATAANFKALAVGIGV